MDDFELLFTNNKQQEQLLDIITNRVISDSVAWDPQDLQPDLILMWNIPNQYYIDNKQFRPISNFITSPSPSLAKVYKMAQEQILSQMTKTKEQEQQTIKLRMQHSFKECPVKLQEGTFNKHFEKDFKFQLECVHERTSILDAFTLQYNSIVYTLQRVCGFRVKSFLLYDQDLSNKKIFFFMRLSIENRLKLATKYQIKKEIDYSQLDLYLNDPVGEDNRPLKLHTDHSFNNEIITLYKRISRLFGARDPHFHSAIIDETPFNFDQENSFLLQTEDMARIHAYFKRNNQPTLSNQENEYVFNYNKGRINKGCRLVYHKTKQRTTFFDLLYYLSDYYQFRSISTPPVYEQFLLPDKGLQGNGYFQRLKAILLYKPQIVSPEGKLDLFLKMERIKLAYVLLKSTFKLSFMKQMGFNFLALPNKFDLLGHGRVGQIKGGINGKNVADHWPLYTYLTDPSVIRGYFGNQVGFEISFKLFMTYFFTSLATIYFLIFLLEVIFGGHIFLLASVFKIVIGTIAFKAYLTLWSSYEEQYVQNFTDDVSSKVFLSQFRGPYVRNILNDEVNEYEGDSCLWAIAKNIVCALIFVALFAIIAAIFFGFQMLLVSIYDSMASLSIGFLSIPHFISYMLFFLLVDAIQLVAINRIIQLLLTLKNPATDEQSQKLEHHLMFIYLLGIETIPPFFFVVLEPFARTSCFSSSCINQLTFYVYSRYLITFIHAIVRTVRMFYVKYKNQFMEDLDQKEENDSFQGRMQSMLLESIKEANKPEHAGNLSFNMVAIISFALYSPVLPLVVVISLTNVLIDGFNVRTDLIFHERRPISKSQAILPYHSQLQVVYFVGIVINAWIIIYSFHTLEKFFPHILPPLLEPITASKILFLQLAFITAISLMMLALGCLSGTVTSHLSSFWFKKRKNQKAKQHFRHRRQVRVKKSTGQSLVPTKTIFRTFNPQTLNHHHLQDILSKVGQRFYRDVLYSSVGWEELGSSRQLRQKDLS